MKNRRTSVEIIAEILALARDGAGKTRIMYGVNMSHSQMERYVAFLLDRSFLRRVERDGSVKYRTTLEGRELLRGIESMAVALGFNGEALERGASTGTDPGGDTRANSTTTPEGKVHVDRDQT